MQDVQMITPIITCLLLVCSPGLASLSVMRYVKSHTGKSGQNFISETAQTTTVGACILVCEQEANTLSVEYARSTGLCVCHSVLPQDLTLVSAANTHIYYDPVCQGAAAGYSYESVANFCFKVHTEKRTWVAAKTICEDEGAVLAKVDTSAKRKLVNSIIRADGSTDYYVGATDIVEDGVWRWTADGSIIPDFTLKGPRNCQEIGSDEVATDSYCDRSRNRFFCEILLQ